MQSLFRPYNFTPLTSTSGRKVYSGDLWTGLIEALYSTYYWQSLRQAFAQISTGNPDGFLKFADSYLDRDEQGHYSSLADNSFMVNCEDKPPMSLQLMNQLDTRYRQAAPFRDDGLGTGHSARDICSFWPAPYALRPHTPVVHQNTPALIVSTTHDPATPYQAGVNLSHQIPSALLTVKDSKHTAVLDNSCVDLIAEEYLIYRNLPANRSVCPAG